MFSHPAFLLSALSAVQSSATDTHDNISTASHHGKRVLNNARMLDGNDDKNNNNNYSWVAGYSIKFEGCATTSDYYGGFFGGENNNNNNGYNNERNNYYGMYEQRLVHFKLCPSDSCRSCEGGAGYVIDLNDFVDAYIESKLSAEQYNCESVRESCYCEDVNDDEACEYQCYRKLGMDYCLENNGKGNNNNGQDQFDLEEAVECRKLDIDNNALNYYYYHHMENQNQAQYYNGNNGERGLYVGPYCSSNGKNIFLGVFTDETCSLPAPDGIYEELNYGQSLPYTKESLVKSNCVSCAEPNEYAEQNYNDQQDGDDITEVCERLYEESGKCETGLNIDYPNTNACDFIQSLKKSMGMRDYDFPSNVFAGLFFVLSIIFGVAIYYLRKKVQRSKVNLSARDGQMV